MIASVEGILVERSSEAVVLVGGLGLSVSLTETAVERLPAAGDTVKLWTHLSVREDGWTLYGFLDRHELGMFRLLITVKGIGPRVALNVLSGAPPARLAEMLAAGDEKGLARLPGIGPKSAARLVVELGGRIPPEFATAETAAGGDRPDVSSDARAAAAAMLSGMGLPPARIDPLLDECLADGPELAGDPVTWVRRALARLGQA